MKRIDKKFSLMTTTSNNKDQQQPCIPNTQKKLIITEDTFWLLPFDYENFPQIESEYNNYFTTSGGVDMEK